MGLGTLPKLVEQLGAHGLPLGTPAVAVERGTTAEQGVAFAELGGLMDATAAHALRSPTLIIIGKVVALAPGWGEWEAAGRPRELAAAAWSARAALPDAAAAVLGRASAAAAVGEGRRRGGRREAAREGEGAAAGAA
jgi:hypothetical protein